MNSTKRITEKESKAGWFTLPGIVYFVHPYIQDTESYQSYERKKDSWFGE